MCENALPAASESRTSSDKRKRQEILSKNRSLRNEGLRLTLGDLRDMNRHLFPSLPDDIKTVAYNLCNFGSWESLYDGTRWFFRKDAALGHITAAVVNDLRDHDTRFFCQLDQVAMLMEEAMDLEKEGLLFGNTPTSQIPFIKQVAERHGYSCPTDFITYDMIVLTDYAKFEEARKAKKKLSSNFAIAPLCFPEDVDYINQSWVHHDEYSYTPIAESILSRPSVSVRQAKQDLVGWALCNSDYALGALFVAEPYRRQGIAKWIIIDLCERLIDANLLNPLLADVSTQTHPHPLAYIDSDNDVSFHLHVQLGFTIGARVGCARFSRNASVLRTLNENIAEDVYE